MSPSRRTPRGNLCLVALVVLLTAASCTPPAPPPERDLVRPAAVSRAPAAVAGASDAAEQELLSSLLGRLQIMHDVAKSKWNKMLPIDDPQREEQLLAALERRGEQFGLSPADTRRLMEAQIEAGKLIQHEDWDEWRRREQPPFVDAPDLQTDLRPQIDRLSEQLLAAYGKLRERLGEPGFRESFRQLAEAELIHAGLNERVRHAALRDWLAPHSAPVAPGQDR